LRAAAAELERKEKYLKDSARKEKASQVSLSIYLLYAII
jgi:hypothetical protein